MISTIALLVVSAQAAANFCAAPRPAALEKLERVTAADAWFDVYRMDERTYAIQETRQAERVISYLILGEKRALLFDSGFGIGRIDRVVAGLTKLPVTVLNSHSHYDHVGGNFAFNDILGFDSEYSRTHAKGTLNAEARRFLEPAIVCPPLPEGVSAETFAIKPYEVRRTVKDKEVIDLGGRELEVLFTPGHSPDSLCLLDRKGKTLFTGDTFYPGNLWLWVPETDLVAYRKSMERISALVPELERLLTAHGVPQADPKVLPKVLAALDEIAAGRAKFEIRNNRRRYAFEGFSILLANPTQP